MKKKILRFLNRYGYSLVKTESITRSEEAAKLISEIKKIISKISPDFKILNGPFKGMQYPSIDITELTLSPKIAGCYESQLNPLTEEILKTSYDHILDVGCAEGYYAVGFGMRKPGTKIHGYDINEKDLEFCRQMAALNNVHNLSYYNKCVPQTLKDFDFGKRSLIFCDCEGYEAELFDETVIPFLKNTDVLIEMHDHIDPSISAVLSKRFSATHNMTVYENLGVEPMQLEGIEKLTPKEKALAVFEHRGGLYCNFPMQWAFFSPKK